jgi:amidase
VSSPPPQPAPESLRAAVRAYEDALMADDLAMLDRLFADEPTTLRGDADGLLVGHDQISAFRNGRGGAPRRAIVQTHVQVIDDDHALVVAVTELARGGRGQQTQLWARSTDRSLGLGGWQVTAAHVAVPGPAFDARIWRSVGDPLVPPTQSGPLTDETVAVKDLYSVAGHPVGAGNPAWLASAAPETEHAYAVRALLDAGASVRGIARTDEFAYSLAGQNVHYGTPANPRAPHRIPGGSSSGSATAVSLGHASIGLGTDTGGSIRVPAAYQGLFGIRTTQGAVERTGLLPLAPSFDTIGWLTRSAATLAAVGDVLLPPATADGSYDLVVVPALIELAHPDVGDAIRRWLPDSAVLEEWPLDELGTWLAAFQTWQAYEAWQSHRAWLATRLDTLGADVRGRFENGARLTPAEADEARQAVLAAHTAIRDLVGDRMLVLPSAASVAPLPAEAQAARNATMRLTCLAGLGGLPAVNLPLRTDRALPCGVSLVAAPGRDRDLLDLAGRLGS